jgi:hypothetical protein
MTVLSPRIVILAPERLKMIIDTEIDAGRREAFAIGLLRLLETMSAFIGATPVATKEPAHCPPRVGTILPSFRQLTELDWTIRQSPEADGLRGGEHVLTGGLVLHPDATPNRGVWGIHT